eukprot:6208613-Pleurochrysis_carterae.AAC.2
MACLQVRGSVDTLLIAKPHPVPRPQVGLSLRARSASKAEGPRERSGERRRRRHSLGRRLGRRGGSAWRRCRRRRRSFGGQRGSGVDMIVRGAEARRVQSTKDPGDEKVEVRRIGCIGDWRATAVPERVAARRADSFIFESELRGRTAGTLCTKRRSLP